MRQETIPRSQVVLILIAYLGFVALGLPDGLLGVAWPSIQGSFSLSVDAIGALLVAVTVGFLLAGTASGRVIARIGVGRYAALGSLIRATALLGYSVAGDWSAMVGLGFAFGLGSGCIDTGMNTYFATNLSSGLMNWLHAAFGLGATLGPVLMTSVLAAGRSWQLGYVVVGLIQAVFVLAFSLTWRRWQLRAPASTDAEVVGPAKRPAALATLRLPVVWLGIALFFSYTGIESSASQWVYSLLTEARGVDVALAGSLVSIYWGSLTVGRLLFGLVVDRLSKVRLLRVVLASVVAGAGMIWIGTPDMLSFAGIALMGLALSSVFPLFVSLTPRRVGEEHAPNAIGFQMAAAGTGFALIPAVAGVMARWWSLEVVGPFLVAISVAMFLLHEAVARYRQ